METIIFLVIIGFLILAFVAGRKMTALQRIPNDGDSVARLKQKQQVMELFIEHKSIVNGDVVSELGISSQSAAEFMAELVGDGHIEQVHEGSYTTYILKSHH